MFNHTEPLKKIFYPILILSIFTAAPAIASETQMGEIKDESESAISSIVATIRLDNNDNLDKQLSIDYELPQFQHLSFTYINNQSAQSELNTIQYNLGATSNPYERFMIGAEYQYWGKDGELETRSLATELSLNFEDWNFSITPQINIITFHITSRNFSQFDVNSVSTNYSVSYYGWDHFLINARYYESHFNNDSFFLNRNKSSIQIRLDRLLSLTTQTLASGLESTRQSLSASYFFSKLSLSANISKSTTAIIKSESTTMSGSLSYPLTEQVEINFGAGVQTTEDRPENLNFYDIGFTYYW